MPIPWSYSIQCEIISVQFSCYLFWKRSSWVKMSNVSVEEIPKVLSIQSHVVSGYAGNRSATFPLQVLGFEVDVINSVQFSNHTGYKAFKGQVLSDKDLSDLMEGLQANNLDFYSHLLTGYVGSPSFLNQIANVIRHVKKVNPDLIYVCDPVMGDNGQMYVPEDLLPIYRDIIIPMADILTPNQFEVELLTGMKINTIEDGWNAIKLFHEKGIKTVVLSSTELSKGDKLLSMASHVVDGVPERAVIHFPKFDANFVGTGDLFAALLLAWMYKTKNDLKTSIENTIATLQKVLTRTMKYAEGHLNKKPECYELKLIQSKKDIENPEVTIGAMYLN